jgi:membrane associated rhomboid family serine protease
MKINDTTADTLTTTSFIGAVASIANQWNPIISALGGLIAIITGLLGAIYYYKKLRK